MKCTVAARSAFLVLLFAACSATPEKKWTIRLAPVAGSIYRYSMVNTNGSTQGADKQEKHNNSAIRTGYKYEIVKDTAGRLLFRITYDTFNLKISTDEIDKELDAARAAISADITEKMFSAFDKAALTVAVDAKGQVSSISGVQELYHKMDSIAGSNEQAKEFLNHSIKANLSEDFFKNTIAQNLTVFPDSAVGPGDSWTVENVLETGLKINYKTVYTLKKIEQGVAYIETAANINIEDQEMKVEDMAATVNLQGSQEGEIKMEQSTGMLLQVSSELNVKGHVTVFGNKVPVKTKTEFELKGERIK